MAVVYLGTVLFDLFFNRSIQYSCVFFDKTFLLEAVTLFVVVLIERWKTTPN